MSEKRIGLDVDGVLGCFSHGVIKRAKELGVEKDFPATCKDVDSWDMTDKFSFVMKDAWIEHKFWLDLPVLEGALPLPFTPHVYITSRRVPASVTKKWLDKNGFPDAPVISVSNPTEKLKYVKDLKIDIFVDDLYSTVREMRGAGINALLFKAPYQRGHEEDCKGLPTIESLDEVLNHV